jgi:hypothetical protein
MLLTAISVSTDGVKEDLFFSVSWVGGRLRKNPIPSGHVLKTRCSRMHELGFLN